MSIENADNQELTNIRYKPRVKDEAWIREYLQQVSFGMLGSALDDQPFVTPTLFVYDEALHAIYFHSATSGRLLTNVSANPQVCFTLAEMGRLLPARTAKEFDVEYSSVMIFGKVRVVEDPIEARHGLDLLMQRYAPHLQSGLDYRSITDDELKITAVYRLDIKAWSGKQNLRQGDPPGAYLFAGGSGS